MRHVLGYGWRDSVPVLRWRHARGRVDTRTLMGPLRLAVGERRCVGYTDGHQRHACPDEAAVDRKQCPACERRDAFRPCLICDGFRCPALAPAVERSCLGRQHLYLAHFGGDEIKVGTASHSRRDARPIEQGPLAVARVASGSGRHIKQIEHLLSTNTELVESMRRSRKLRLLRAGLDVETARAQLTTTWERVRRQLREEDTPLLHDPVFVAQPPLARQTRAALGGAELLPVVEGRLLAGDVIGAVGHVLLLEEPAGRFLLDLGELTARLVDPDPPRALRRPDVQLSLL